MILYHGSNVVVSEPRLIKKLYNQLALTSEKALNYLKFVGTVPEGEL